MGHQKTPNIVARVGVSPRGFRFGAALALICCAAGSAHAGPGDADVADLSPDHGTLDHGTLDHGTLDHGALDAGVEGGGCVPGCHWDCFGGVACQAGQVYKLAVGARECCHYSDPWPDPGPDCSGMGGPDHLCASKVCASSIEKRWAGCFATMNSTNSSVEHLLQLHCKGSAPKGAGTTCSGDADCRPSSAGPGERLVCFEGACASRARQPAPKGYGGHCGLVKTDIAVAGLAWDTDHVVIGERCPLCQVIVSPDNGCLRQACTMPCKFDDDCPPNSVCLCAAAQRGAALQFCAAATGFTDVKQRTAWLGCDPKNTGAPGVNSGPSEPSAGCSCGVSGSTGAGVATLLLLMLLLGWARGHRK